MKFFKLLILSVLLPACSLNPTSTQKIQDASSGRVVWVSPQSSEGKQKSRHIWEDDFDDPQKLASYMESSGSISSEVRMGESGSSLEMLYPKGEQGVGGRKIVFGDSPTGTPLRSEDSFDEIFTRYYLYHPTTWLGGGPAKLSRIIGFSGNSWQQFCVVHIWDGREGGLTLDPVTGVKDDKVLTEHYNDFDHFSWLGSKPESGFKLYSAAELGRWLLVETQMRLNAPGVADGYLALWIDGKLEIERTGLNLRGSYTEHGINAVFLEAYKNEGSTVTQSRYIDEFIVSNKRIGPITANKNPIMLIRLDEQNNQSQVQVAKKLLETRSLVWESKPIVEAKLRVSSNTGSFIDSELTELSAGDYLIRVRQGRDLSWSKWSDWHQPFRIK